MPLMPAAPRRPKARLIRVAGAALLVIIVVVAARQLLLSSHEDGSVAASASASPSVCANEPPKFIRSKFLRSEPYAMSIDPSRKSEVRLATSCGTMLIKLFPKQSPIAVNNFANLAKDAWYTGTYFFRIVKDLDIIQAGDPSGTGTRGPGYTIPDDAPNGLHYEIGSVVMWRGDTPDSAGAQFLIITGPEGLADLPPGLTVFGKLADTASLQVAQKIQSVPVEGDAPLEKVWLLGVHVEENP